MGEGGGKGKRRKEREEDRVKGKLITKLSLNSAM